MISDCLTNDKLSELSRNKLIELKEQIKTSKLYYRDSLGIDKNITFGMEIEYEDLDKRLVDSYIKTKQYDWVSDFDDTVSTGGEVKSYILTDKITTWNELGSICYFLEEKQAVTNKDAGGHIHIGSHILKGNYVFWRQFLKTYILYEKELLTFLAGEEKQLRPLFRKYASPIAPAILEDIDCLNNVTDFLDIYYQVFFKDRNWAVNFTNVLLDSAKRYHKNTLEFRSPNSSKKDIIWQNNINTLVKLMIAPEKGLVDEEFIDYKLSKGFSNIRSDEKALELVDTIFDNNVDKLYFLKQYTKSFSFDKKLHLGKVKSVF